MSEDPSEQDKSKAKSQGLLGRALGEASDNFGRELAPVGVEAGKVAARATNALLKTASAAIWGYEKIQDWIEGKVAKKLEGIPEEDLTEPDLRIAGPAIEAMRFANDADEIQELFAQLIASDMQIALKKSVHPSFVEMVKQMDAADSRVFRVLSNSPPQIKYTQRIFAVPNNPSAYFSSQYNYTFEVEGLDVHQIERALNSLQRLGLVEIRKGSYPIDPSHTKKIDDYQKSERFAKLKSTFQAKRSDIEKDGIYRTPLGAAFSAVCFAKVK